MGHSKNDMFFEGGDARIITHPHLGQQDAIFMLINPSTNKPYRKDELIRDLQCRKKQFPTFAPLIDVHLKKLISKFGDSKGTFQIMSRGKSEELAIARLKKERIPQLRDIARILFRPTWNFRFQHGQVTISQYAEYMENKLFSNASPDARRHMLACVKHVIVPAIGNSTLVSIPENKEKFINKINKLLRQKNYGNSQTMYVKRAYKSLFEQIEQDGYHHVGSLAALSNLINIQKKRNNDIIRAFKPNHLDTDQRNRFFSILSQPENLYALFLVSLHYCGLAWNEIAAMRFGDVEELCLSHSFCYCILIDKIVRKLGKRYSTLSLTNDAFPVPHFRKVVLYPWAADIMNSYVQHLQNQGYTLSEIESMRLSDNKPGGAIQGPSEIEALIKPLLRQANINFEPLTRTDTKGNITQQHNPPDSRILWEDAQYVAENFCGANIIMLHAMFGLPWTETDEKSYLDLLSDNYAVARFIYLRRFNPFNPHRNAKPFCKQNSKVSLSCVTPENSIGKYILSVKNVTTSPQILKVTSDYGLHINWKEAPP